MIFQVMFAVITPALIIGAFAERMKFSAFLVFSLLWATLVYDPIAHWVWGIGGWLRELGALDFAGGIVVHISAGMAALAAALGDGQAARGIQTCRLRTTCPWPFWARPCCGSDGSASTPAAPWGPTASRLRLRGHARGGSGGGRGLGGRWTGFRQRRPRWA